MTSSTGTPGFSAFYPSPFQQQGHQILPPIHDLGLGTPGAPPSVQDPNRRPRARSRPLIGPGEGFHNGARVRRYYIEELPYDMEVPSNEDHNMTARRTVDGRTLKYTLTVLQQPERARACGAGARCES